MRVTIERDAFLPRLAELARIADSHASMPILANVLLRSDGAGELVAAATDLRLTGIARLPVKIEAPGEMTVSAATLLEVVKAIPSAVVSLEVTGPASLRVSGGGKVFNLPGFPGRDFPKLPTEPETWHTIDAGPVVGMLAAVFPTISKDEARHHMYGTALESTAGGERLTALATDGCRAAREAREVGAALPQLNRAILPRDAVKRIVAMWRKAEGRMGFALHLGHFHFRAGGLWFVARQIEAQFPPLETIERQAAEDGGVTVEVDAAEFADAIGRAALVSKMVRVHLGTGVMRVSAGEVPYQQHQRWFVPRKTHGAFKDGRWQEIDDGPDETKAGWVDCSPDEYLEASKRNLDWRGESIATDLDVAHTGDAAAWIGQSKFLLESLGKKPAGKASICFPPVVYDDKGEFSLKPLSVSVGGKSCLVMPHKELGEAWPIGMVPAVRAEDSAAPSLEVLPSAEAREETMKTTKDKAPAPEAPKAPAPLPPPPSGGFAAFKAAKDAARAAGAVEVKAPRVLPPAPVKAPAPRLEKTPEQIADAIGLAPAPVAPALVDCETCGDLRTVPVREAGVVLRVDPCPSCMPREDAPTVRASDFEDEPTARDAVEEVRARFVEIPGGKAADKGRRAVEVVDGSKVTHGELGSLLDKLLAEIEAVPDLLPRERRRRLKMAKDSLKASMLATCKCGIVHPGPPCPICGRIWDPAYGPAAMHKLKPALWRELLAWVWADLTKEGLSCLAGDKITPGEEEIALSVWGEEHDEVTEQIPPIPAMPKISAAARGRKLGIKSVPN